MAHISLWSMAQCLQHKLHLGYVYTLLSLTVVSRGLDQSDAACSWCWILECINSYYLSLEGTRQQDYNIKTSPSRLDLTASAARQRGWWSLHLSVTGSLCQHRKSHHSSAPAPSSWSHSSSFWLGSAIWWEENETQQHRAVRYYTKKFRIVLAQNFCIAGPQEPKLNTKPFTRQDQTLSFWKIQQLKFTRAQT